MDLLGLAAARAGAIRGAGVGVGAQTNYSTYTEMYWHAVHNSCITGSNNAPLYAALDYVAFPASPSTICY